MVDMDEATLSPMVVPLCGTMVGIADAGAWRMGLLWDFG